jgi:hypothetical protein
MADDWIKMRVNLHTHPKVGRIASAVCPQLVRDTIGKTAAKCMVVGALHAAWCLFDMHSLDGRLDGYSPEDLDHVVGLAGFSSAMEHVGWLNITNNCLQMRDFDDHNGKGAKRRAEDTTSKRERRLSAKCPQSDRTQGGPEKRREEKSTRSPLSPPKGDGDAKKHPRVIPAYTDAFNDFWNRYPTANRLNKKGAFKVWCKQHIEREAEPGKLRMLDCVMAGLDKWCQCERWKAGFVCAPTVFLNQARWSNDPPHSERQS